MKIGICSAMAKEIDISLDYIGVDRGIEVLIDQGINPIYAIGDFDSIRDENLLSNLKIERLPTRKDVTDTHAALEYAIDKGYDEKYGARPLRRTIQSLLEDKMAEEILDGKIKKSAGVEAGCEDGRLVFTVKKKAAARRKTAAPKALAKVSRQTHE